MIHGYTPDIQKLKQKVNEARLFEDMTPCYMRTYSILLVIKFEEFCILSIAYVQRNLSH